MAPCYASESVAPRVPYINRILSLPPFADNLPAGLFRKGCSQVVSHLDNGMALRPGEKIALGFGWGVVC